VNYFPDVAPYVELPGPGCAVVEPGGVLEVEKLLYALGLTNPSAGGSSFVPQLAVAAVDGAQQAAMEALVALNPPQQIVPAPTIVLHDGQRAAVMLKDEYGPLLDLLPGFREMFDPFDPSDVASGPVLDVVPVISADRRFVTLAIRPSIAGSVQTRRPFEFGPGLPADAEVPLVQPSGSLTRVTVPDGETVILGGLRVEGEVKEGVPVLGKVPFLGSLFRERRFQREDQNLMILITPRIVGGSPP
jgi:type II secretory pathway component HofQ